MNSQCTIIGDRGDGFVCYNIPQPDLAIVIIYSYTGQCMDLIWNTPYQDKPQSINDK